MSGTARSAKVPAATLGFWLIKIVATTLGETGGDAVTMSMGLGYLAGTAISAVCVVLAVGAQWRLPRFVAPVYWLAVVATTTAGTTLADYCDRSLGLGYPGGVSILAALLLLSLAAWRLSLGKIAADHVVSPRAELFYWVTIMFSQTLGTALGDFAADDGGLGYAGGALVFGGAICVVALLYWATRLPRVVLFWAAFVLTRPLGATLGDFLDKPVAHGGLALGRVDASAVLLGLMTLGILVLPQRPAAARA